MGSPSDDTEARAAYKVRLRQQIADHSLALFHGDAIDRVELDEAIRRIEKRSEGGIWNTDRLRHKVPRPRPHPSDSEIAPALPSDAVELLIVRLLARTSGTGQFSVTPAGDIFTGVHYGYHTEAERLYVTTLSPLLDDAAALLLFHDQDGGRLFVHTSRFLIEVARDQTTLARIEIS